ncbi:MAG: SGNH/GDSL hydrolase family protein [Halioglobus sp.]|nr:SGNH/GDSL hydrolase family protein [Halioglobus sp.]
MKSVILGFLSVVIALVLLSVCAEVATRAWYAYQAHVNDEKLGTIISLDHELGWVPTSHYAFDGELLDAGGNPYDANISTDGEGFRLYGDPEIKERRKVLFLGDSFTQAMHVSDDNTYYGLLGSELGIEVFAYGVEGYGTLQEYMVLDKYVDEIAPDVVVLQLCPNDVINNHPALERRSTLNRMGLRRPYLVDGEVVYETAADMPGLRNFAAKYSRSLYTIIKKIDLLNVDPESSVERVIRKEGMDNDLFRESYETAGKVLRKLRQRLPDSTEVYAFSSDWGRPYHPNFKRIVKEAGISFIDGTGRALSIVEKRGGTTRAADTAHWNNKGHRIVADVLKQYLQDAWSEPVPAHASP